MPDALCPECHTVVSFEDAPGLGQPVECPGCCAVLEVIRLLPLELDWRFEEPLPKTGRLEGTVA